MKTLYLESMAGIAGDMFTASFLDAGIVSLPELQALCQQLSIPDVEITQTEVIRAQMRATHLNVQYDEQYWRQRFPSLHHHGQPHIHDSKIFHVYYRDLEHLLHHSQLAENTRQLACKILSSLADAEARCHGVSKNEVAFHELGMIDSLMDIVMAAHCVSIADPETIVASPIKLGRGLITTSHGTLPVPPPVSAALAVGMPVAAIPGAIQRVNVELSTPTGLAILKTLQPIFLESWPNGIVLAQGYGAGSMDLETYPNLFRIGLFEAVKQPTTLPYRQDTIIEITANYDDTTPEHLAWATEKLFALNAVDVWQTTAVGKKGRVTIVLSVLVHETHWEACIDFMLKKTSTFGLRYRSLERMTLDRHFETRDIGQGSYQIKIGSDLKGKKLKEKFEFEDIRRVWDNEM